MNVLLASAEAVPFAKVGGLADVVGSLPSALRAGGIDARVILPGYGFISHVDYGIEPLFAFDLAHHQGSNPVALYACEHDGMPAYLLQAPPFFGLEDEVYSHWQWDMARYVFFNQALMAALWQLMQRGWFPDVIHLNDWHTGLLPFLLRQPGIDSAWTSLATALSIHNIAYQGAHAGAFLHAAGIPPRHDPELAAMGLSDNLLALGIRNSDMIATVSPRYAAEIQYAYAGYELAPLIESRASDLRGILNGLDTDLWDPAADPHLISKFDATDSVTERPPNKAHLQNATGLPVESDAPLIGVVSRLAAQKGFDMALPALREVLGARPCQLVVLGSGESDIESAFGQLAADFHEQVRVNLGFDESLARQIYAGCDLFLMPSHFEPCGMGQMIAMRYGALPLVRETGGLADTVVNYDNGEADAGTGFVFQWQEADAVAGTLNWALDVYAANQAAWRRMQQRGMKTDFSWRKSAAAYRALYMEAMDKVQERGSDS